MERQRIGIIGGGVSGLVTAHLLHPRHEVTVFEARDRVGGHVRTVAVSDEVGGRHQVDVGFIVYNETNYPLFTRILQDLGLTGQASDMSFGVRSDRSGIEYSTATVRSLFSQRENLLRPRFYRMVAEILRFQRDARWATRSWAASMTLGEYLHAAAFGQAFVEEFLEPMGSALWSIPRGSVLEMPAHFFVRFFDNHGMLSAREQPEWLVVPGGSRRYVERLIAPFEHRLRLRRPIQSVQRGPDEVRIDGEPFDHVVFACHADQALALLDPPSELERTTLASLPFQRNSVVLHTDTNILPAAREAWASWNYRVNANADEAPTVTYNMNRLQSVRSPTTFLVTLNDRTTIDPDRILFRTEFSHPRFTLDGIRAQHAHSRINGVGRTHFCGAYWGFGFHEDGVRSAYQVAERFGVGA